jgi:nucleoside-diphosphate-sugar epimerase
MEKVLVTGATGFLGRHTVQRLLKEGAQVTGLGRSLSHGRELERMGARFVAAELSEEKRLDEIFRGHDYVIHCAALSSPWGRYEDFYNANVKATENVLRAVRQAGIKRLVHVSTPSLYIDHTDRLDVREEEPLPLRAINFYAATKRLAEERVDAAAADGLPVVSIRPQGIIGPGDTAIFPRLMRMARKKILPIIGDGDNWIDLTYVDNVVESLVLALRAPAHVHGRKYNITNGEPVQLYPLLREVFDSLGFTYREKRIPFRRAYRLAGAMEFVCRYVLRGREPLLTRYSVCALGLTRTLNIDAARRDLNYRPIIDMRQAVERLTQTLRTEN